MITYTAVETAKLVRAALKKNFPHVKFSVKSRIQTIDISYTDGPIADDVRNITNNFSGMSFDGMQDMNTYHHQDFNGEKVRFYCYAPNVERKLSMELAQKIKAAIESQGIKCPEIKWNDYEQAARFQIQDSEDWHDQQFLRKKISLFTWENVETLRIWESSEVPDITGQDVDQEFSESSVITQRRTIYESRISRRKAAAQNGISRHQQLSDSCQNRASQMARAIPFGQPILVGHHSEGRDRRYRAKIGRLATKAQEHENTVKHYQNKLSSMNFEYVISSDDPDAIPKLKQKIEALEINQQKMVAANKIIRSSQLSQEQKAEWLKLNGHDESLLTGRFAGYEGYKLSNNSANIRSTKLRLVSLEKQLEKAEQAETVEVDHPELGLKVVENNLINRVQIIFTGKPCKEVREVLKTCGFRWAPSQGAWQRQQGGSSRFGLDRALAEIGKHQSHC
jgi:Domain of unknown function (DUF3560)/Large polyvalent protein associated domain 29